MSKRKKLSHTQKVQMRQARALVFADPDSAHDDEIPPPEAVDAYLRAYEWMARNPEAATTVMDMKVDEIFHSLVGIAYADELGHPEDQCLMIAEMIRTWNILNGFKYFMEWTTPVAAMSPHQIIEQARQDRADGVIPALTTDE